MPSLIQPRFVALDSAQLSDWARAHLSANMEQRRKARLFEDGLVENAIIPLISWHHLEELIGTENISAAEAAITLLSSLPLVAWFECANGGSGLSTVVRMLAAELLGSLEYPEGDALVVRDVVRNRCLRIGEGSQMMAPYLEIWRDLQPHLWADAKERRESFSITASQLFEINDMKVKDALRRGIRQGENLARQLASMQLSLQRDISKFGDDRIADHADVSARFFTSVRQTGPTSPKSVAELTLWMLEMQDIDPDEIGPETTFGEIFILGLFRKQLALAARAVNVDPTRVKAVRMEQLPTWLIERSLARHRQVQLERRGSEPIDAHLASLAPYADVTFVDRRTAEALRQAHHKKSLPENLLRSVLKSRPYSRVLSSLSSIDVS